MYPNLFYVFKDWFGVEWEALKILNTFGLMVAMGFVTAAIVISSELKRKEKQGLLFPREEFITVGKPATLVDLLINFIVGFIFGFKVFGFNFNMPAGTSPQSYIFSLEGSIAGGLVLAIFLAGLKWWEKNKQKLKEPEQRGIRIWPHDRVGDIVIISLVFGILGAKLFDNLENWEDFIQNPLERIFSAGGLTFYGGLIAAGIAICVYAAKKGIKLIHLVDAISIAMLLAYAVGRIGCQVSGDGDWGVYNSAYVTDASGKVALAKDGDFQAQLERYKTYFLDGTVLDSGKTTPTFVTDRKSASLQAVPHRYVKALSFMPVWMVAYNYPQNVNNDGVLIPGNYDDHNRVLPQPVFPTPFYETVVCTLLFLIVWAFRKRIHVAGTISGIYFIINGLERFLVEKIRVNNQYHFWGIHPSQAEIISFFLILTGVIIIITVHVKSPRKS
ncbi:MAG: prolipoprotein diacylglyceryl transferase [Rhizobacter sp.]|nr:prolipoprotein diacylglyceryl transferase [Ferruginibacter sp.]